MIFFKIVGVAALIISGVVTLFIQRQNRGPIQAEIAALESRAAEVSRARQQQQRLLARQPTAAELDSLRTRHAELRRLRAELAAFPATDAVAAGTERYPVTATGSVFNPARVGTADLKVKAEWRNAGIATPANSFETSLWAEQVGDIDVLVTTMLFGSEARIKAQEIFNGLSPADRAKFGSPERLIAMLSVGAGDANRRDEGARRARACAR